MRIMLVGPDRSVKGGITTVIEGILASELAKRHTFLHLSTHRDDLSKMGKLGYGIKAYANFLKAHRQFRPQLIHIHSSFGASFYRKAILIVMARLLRTKVINHIHGAEFDRFYESAGSIKKRLVKTIYDYPETTIVLSQEWVNRIESIVHKSKVFCLNNFAVIPDMNVDEMLAGYHAREKNILFLGEVGKRKGAYDLPDIVKHVSESIPDTHFVVAGNGNIEAVRQQLHSRACDQYVTFTGWIGPEQKKEWLTKSQIFLLPSYNEGLPMSVLEAMSYGLPVVSTLVGGIPGLVETGKNGYLYPPGDTKGIAEGLVNIFQHPKQALEICKANIEKIKRNYSLETTMDQLESIYRQTVREERTEWVKN